MYRFLIVVEKANGNYSAYSPDLPGCVATGKTRVQVTRNMHEAIEMHVGGLLEDKLPIPKSYSFAEYIAVPWSGQRFQAKSPPNTRFLRNRSHK